MALEQTINQSQKSASKIIGNTRREEIRGNVGLAAVYQRDMSSVKLK